MSNSKQLPSYRMFVRDDSCIWTDLGIVEAATPEDAFMKVLMRTTEESYGDGKMRGWSNAEYGYNNDPEELRQWYRQQKQEGIEKYQIQEISDLSEYFPLKVNGATFSNENSAAIYAIELETWRAIDDIRLPMKGVKEAWAIAMQAINEQLYTVSEDNTETLKERIKRAKELITDIWNKCIRLPPQDFTEADKILIPATARLVLGGGMNWAWFQVNDGDDAVTFRLHNGDPNISRLLKDFEGKIDSNGDINPDGKWEKHKPGDLNGKFDWLYMRYPKNEERCTGIWNDCLTRAKPKELTGKTYCKFCGKEKKIADIGCDCEGYKKEYGGAKA